MSKEKPDRTCRNAPVSGEETWPKNLPCLRGIPQDRCPCKGDDTCAHYSDDGTCHHTEETIRGKRCRPTDFRDCPFQEDVRA